MGYIKIVNEVSINFDAPYVNLTIDKISNTDSTRSGTISVELYNIQYKNPQGFGLSNRIAAFTLNALQGGYYYHDIQRRIPMQNDVDYPYMVLIVKQKYTTGYQISDYMMFNNAVNRIKRRPPSSRNFRVRPQNTFNNNVKTVGKIASTVGTVAGVVGTVGGMFFPPLKVAGMVVGAIGNGIGSFIDTFF